MGTDVEIRLADSAGWLLSFAEDRVARFERMWSRFDPESELSALNRASGRPSIVSAATIELLAAAVDGFWRTDGLFDPRIIDSLEAHGYDRSFDRIDPAASVGGGPAPGGPIGRPLTIELLEEVAAVVLPRGERWDLGGIGKGFTADRLVEELWREGAGAVLVNMGGDMRMHGDAFGEPAWTVAIDHPLADGVLAEAHLHEGAVATSSRLTRRWHRRGAEAHHLIDPRTGAPAETDLVAVSVVASSAWWAEVLAKAALIAGRADGTALVERHGCSAVLVGTRTDDVTTVGDHIRLRVGV
ncbi:MAG: FAD:protein FMN transferase [Acidimicrobiales bacterium]|nr:FAD:protein FMN transferase [Acidimicrobiales bacterium]